MRISHNKNHFESQALGLLHYVIMTQSWYRAAATSPGMSCRERALVLFCSVWSSCHYRVIIVGTCESFFCVRIEFRIELAVRFDF